MATARIKTHKIHTFSSFLSLKIMRILHFVLILAVAILLKNVYCDSSNPLPNAPFSSLPKPKASPFQVLATNDKVRTPPTPPPPPPPPSKVTSYTMVVQWPPGVCSGKLSDSRTCKIPTVPTEFKIHGLWPEYLSTDPPTPKTFDISQLANMSTELTNSWPNLYSAQQQLSYNLIFWNAEWNKHGRYSEMEGLVYFRKTLDLFKDVGQGLKGKLEAKQIKPVNAQTNNQTYTLVKIETALKDINGNFSCTVRCVPSIRDNVPQIQEIQFSYEQNFKKRNNLARSNCGSNVRFPA